MFSSSQNSNMVEVLSGPERRRTPQGKIAIIQQTIRFLFIKKISSNIISWGVNLNGLFFYPDSP